MEPMWLWGVAGLVLLAIEMATGTFYVLWFGVAALCVSFITWLFPATSSAVQFFIFAVLSLGSLNIWRIFYKKNETHSRVGQAQGEEIGRVGIIIQVCSQTHNGKIRFTQGVMGSREWAAASDETIEIGSNASVIAVEGNTLRVQAVS
jgi:membrane protein implicated in regulation of membrane protease activity